MLKRVLIATTALCLLSACGTQARDTGQPAVVPSAGISTPAVVESGPVAPPAQLREDLIAVVESGVPGATAIVMRDGKLLYRVDVGKPELQYQIASASKWLTAALVMTVVDEGKLSLDAPISKVLPEFKGESGTVTLRELLAQTSGEGSLRSFVDIRQDPRMTLEQSAAQVAQRPLENKPDTVFEYGGPGFQVAGAMVEKVTGKTWAQLFQERIAGPLGMTHTYWQHLPARGVSPADTRNPLLQGGAVSSAEDYAHFLTMLAQGGVYEGHRVLSQKAIDEMETAQTIGKRRGFVPPTTARASRELQYALGNWCEVWESSGKCDVVSSPGMFGTDPWIDRQSGTYGIFFLKGEMTKVSPQLQDALKAILLTAK